MDNVLKKYVEFTKKWEGGLSKDKSDSASKFPCPTPYKGISGYHTNIGITYTVWSNFYGKDKDQRFFEMTAEEWFKVFKTLYWNQVKADEFKSINVAIFVTGMAWGSGKSQAIKSLQQALINCGVLKKEDKDGIIGNKTITAANSISPRVLFDALIEERRRFFNVIGRPGTKNNKFLKGWLNRLNDYIKEFRP
jgi:lysozyme family protein